MPSEPATTAKRPNRLLFGIQHRKTGEVVEALANRFEAWGRVKTYHRPRAFRVIRIRYRLVSK